MSDFQFAIIGGGPAGSMLASLLAHSGREVLLIDRHGPWEKPCGGGVTPKALRRYEWLLRSDGYPHATVNEITLVAPSGRSVSIPFDEAFYVYSRAILNQMLYDRAIDAGSHLLQSTVESIARQDSGWKLQTRAGSLTCRFLVGADGANSLLRRLLFGRFADEDLSATFGYRVPSGDRSKTVVEFLPSFSGYLWAFPRLDHVSFGIINKAGNLPGNKLREFVLLFIARSLERIDWLEQGETNVLEGEVIAAGASPYGAIVPTPRRSTLEKLQVAGDDWALAGDAAGFVDPITGEGIYYALRSAELLAHALIDGHPLRYEQDWREEFGRELMTAASYVNRFYSGDFLGKPVIEQTVRFTDRFPRLFRVLSDTMTGDRPYRTLRWQLLRAIFFEPKRRRGWRPS